MKIDATVEQIRALLQFAESNEGEGSAGPPAQRQGREVRRKVLPRSLVERYHALIDAGRRPAVAAIERGMCSGCHIRLPTAVESQTRRVAALHVCPSCRRMLYVPELVREHSPDGDAEPAAHAAPLSGAARS